MKTRLFRSVALVLTLSLAWGGVAYAVEYENWQTNTRLGLDALLATTGSENTAIGFLALNANTTGTYNTATGATALYINTTGYGNTMIEPDALAFRELRRTSDGVFVKVSYLFRFAH